MELNSVVIRYSDTTVKQTKLGDNTDGWGSKLGAGIYFEREKCEGKPDGGIELEFVAENGGITLWKAK